MGNGRMRGEKGGKRWGPQGLVHTPCPKSRKYPDCRCRTDLIGGGGDTDLCPGRQTPSRRHWQTEIETKMKTLLVQNVFLGNNNSKVVTIKEQQMARKR